MEHFNIGMKDLIIKYLTDDLTDLEHEQLLIWLKKPKNLKEFRALVKENYSIDMVYGNLDEEAALRKVKSKINNNEKPVKKLFWFYAAAAAVTLLISLTLIFNGAEPQSTETTVVNNSIKVGTDKATLILDDGTEIALEKGKSYKKNNLESNGNEIIYQPLTDPAVEEVVYNYLIIPRGGQYYLKLADGTKVWLNSESKLKYPTFFSDGKEREVELIYGEAYFDVSPSTEHGGSQFKVLTNQQKVAVLGTEFNIKAYPDDHYIFTTLVEGQIAVSNSNGGMETILRPNQQSIIKTNYSSIEVVNTNVYNEISWKEGVFSFEQMTLKNIMKVLSRWYDIEVVFTDPNIETITFNGILRKNQQIEDILKPIQSINNITYEIKDGTIIFK